MAYSTERRITEHEPVFGPLGPPLAEPRVEQEVVEAASSEASAREMALMRNLNYVPPKPPAPLLRQPRLHDDHAQHVADLKQKIYERGISVDRDKLLSLGRARFARLLNLDRVARSERIIGTTCELSSFPERLFRLRTSRRAGTLGGQTAVNARAVVRFKR